MSRINLPQLAHKGVPVVTSETLAQVYEVKPVSIRKNFTTNKDRFIEGKHFYTLSGNDLKEFKNRVTESNSVQIGKNAKSLTLWTERGAARHAKMLNSDKAWDMFELLEETFFRVAEQKQDDRLSTVEDRRPLNAIVRAWAQASDQKYSMCWKQVNSAFGLESATEFPARWIPDAVAWVQEKLDALPTPAELPEPSPAPSWPLELADYAMKGNGQPVNFWKELKKAESILKGCASAVALACHSGSLMYMTPEKHLFHRILSQSADHAAASIMMALQDVNTCLSVKHKIDFFKS